MGKPSEELLMIEIIPNWHPIFVHFSVALLAVAAALYLFSAMLSPESASRAQMAMVARWNLWLGFLISIGTATAGLSAFNSVTHDDVSHAAMTLHRNFALGTLAAYVPFVIASAVDAMRNRVASGAFGFALLVPTALLAVTAWRGGELVYRYGLGVQSLPDVEAHHHKEKTAEGIVGSPAGEAAPVVTPETLPPSGEMPAETSGTPESAPLQDSASVAPGNGEPGVTATATPTPGESAGEPADPANGADAAPHPHENGDKDHHESGPIEPMHDDSVPEHNDVH